MKELRLLVNMLVQEGSRIVGDYHLSIQGSLNVRSSQVQNKRENDHKKNRDHLLITKVLMEDFGVSQDVIEELENSADAEAKMPMILPRTLPFQTRIKSMFVYVD